MGIKRGVPRSWRIASTASFLSRFPLLRVPLFCLDIPTFTSLLHLFVFGWWSFNGAFASFESGFPAIFCSPIVSQELLFFSVFLFLFLFLSVDSSLVWISNRDWMYFFYWLFPKKMFYKLIERLGRKNRFGRFFYFLFSSPVIFWEFRLGKNWRFYSSFSRHFMWINWD